MFIYNTFQKANNKGADQTAWMRRLICALVVRQPPKTGAHIITFSFEYMQILMLQKQPIVKQNQSSCEIINKGSTCFTSPFSIFNVCIKYKYDVIQLLGHCLH